MKQEKNKKEHLKGFTFITTIKTCSLRDSRYTVKYRISWKNRLMNRKKFFLNMIMYNDKVSI